ncbi:hypothetical protein ACEWY4_011782 [Coilia grayii]|uniref:Chemokine interleukin-8-like domain-containing protein n=1 Tax=Coilia grayii TaxID=363190 RepID=A0ABD1JYM5_9TELE
MTNITVTLLLLLLMAALIVNGVPMNTSQRCSCKGTVKLVRCPNISGVRVYPSSPFCDRTEIVVKRRMGHMVCLDPTSRQAKRILSSNVSPHHWSSVQCRS